MKRTILVIPMIVLILAMTLITCRPAKKDAASAVKAAADDAADVKVERISRRKVAEKIVYTGTIEALKKTSITPENGGKVARILVREGDRVQKGQILAELETEALRLQLQQAEAGIAVAEAGYNDALKNKERMDRLIKEKAVSEQHYEQVKLGYDAADAQLRQARAALNLARHALDVSIMKAPWSGVIASKNVEVGDVINPMMGGFSSTSGVLTLMDFSKVKVVIEVTQNDILNVRKGQTVTLRTPSLPGKEFPGEVTIVNLTADAATKKFLVETVFDNPGLNLRPGTFGDVMLDVKTRDAALAVPQSAILENRYVYIVQGGRAVKRDVSLGIQNTEWVEVLNGVAEGEVVIVDGNYGLEEGAAVRIEEEVKR